MTLSHPHLRSLDLLLSFPYCFTHLDGGAHYSPCGCTIRLASWERRNVKVTSQSSWYHWPQKSPERVVELHQMQFQSSLLQIDLLRGFLLARRDVTCFSAGLGNVFALSHHPLLRAPKGRVKRLYERQVPASVYGTTMRTIHTVGCESRRLDNVPWGRISQPTREVPLSGGCKSPDA